MTDAPDLHKALTDLCDAADAEVFGDEVEKADLRRLLAEHAPTESVVDREALAEAWSEGYQDGWSDRAHPGEDRFRNPYRNGGEGL